MEDGLFRKRKPPKVTWLSDYGPSRPANAIIGAKGLVPVLKISGPEKPNLVIPDIMEIGGIEDLRQNRFYYEALSMACTHAEFQGKRIIQLLKKEKSFTLEDNQKIYKICKKSGTRVNRVGKWTLSCIAKVLFKLDVIAKDEYKTLTELRIIRNSLQHQAVAKYKIDTEQVNCILQESIQVLLRMRELPIALTTKITGYEEERFWKDLGFGGASALE